jgi:hypothetical protein
LQTLEMLPQKPHCHSHTVAGCCNFNGSIQPAAPCSDLPLMGHPVEAPKRVAAQWKKSVLGAYRGSTVSPAASRPNLSAPAAIATRSPMPNRLRFADAILIPEASL